MVTTIEQRKMRELLDELRSLVRELCGGPDALLPRLRELVTTKGSRLNGGSSGKSRSLININAYDLLQSIKQEYGRSPEMVLRHSTIYLAEQCSELAELSAIVDRVRDLAQSIRDTLDPPRRMHLRDGKGRAAACPSCGARTFKRRDLSGQEVLGPTLAIDQNGCECQSCGTSWSPGLFEWLARVIADDGQPQPLSGDLSGC